MLLLLLVLVAGGFRGVLADAEACSAAWNNAKAKMEAEKLSPEFIAAFKHSFDAYVAGSAGAILEEELSPIPDGAIPSLAKLKASGELGAANTELLDKLVMFKLNGGLGTSMGLERAKSLLTVRNGTVSFLDLIAQQVLAVREKYGR